MCDCVYFMLILPYQYYFLHHQLVFNLCFIGSENFAFHGLRVISYLYTNSRLSSLQAVKTKESTVLCCKSYKLLKKRKMKQRGRYFVVCLCMHILLPVWLLFCSDAYCLRGKQWFQLVWSNSMKSSDTALTSQYAASIIAALGYCALEHFKSSSHDLVSFPRSVSWNSCTYICLAGYEQVIQHHGSIFS